MSDTPAPRPATPLGPDALPLVLLHPIGDADHARRCREAFKASQAAKPRWVGKPKRRKR